MPGFAQLGESHIAEMLRFMLENGILFEDEGCWSIGVKGESAFGRRHFMDLLSAFTSDPLFTVKHGQLELGRVHHASFAVRRAGRSPASVAARREALGRDPRRLGRAHGVRGADD